MTSIIVISGCSDPPIRSTHLGGWEFPVFTSQSNSIEGSVYAFGSMNLCRSSEEITLDEVLPLKVEGPVKVDRFVVRTKRSGDLAVGAQEGKLQEGWQAVKSFRVSQSCGDGQTGSTSEMGVEAVRTGAGSAVVGELEVRYHVGSKSFSTIYPYSFSLCDSNDRRLIGECK